MDYSYGILKGKLLAVPKDEEKKFPILIYNDEWDVICDFDEDIDFIKGNINWISADAAMSLTNNQPAKLDFNAYSFFLIRKYKQIESEGNSLIELYRDAFNRYMSRNPFYDTLSDEEKRSNEEYLKMDAECHLLQDFLADKEMNRAGYISQRVKGHFRYVKKDIDYLSPQFSQCVSVKYLAEKNPSINEILIKSKMLAYQDDNFPRSVKCSALYFMCDEVPFVITPSDLECSNEQFDSVVEMIKEMLVDEECYEMFYSNKAD